MKKLLLTRGIVLFNVVVYVFIYFYIQDRHSLIPLFENNKLLCVSVLFLTLLLILFIERRKKPSNVLRLLLIVINIFFGVSFSSSNTGQVLELVWGEDVSSLVNENLESNFVVSKEMLKKDSVVFLSNNKEIVVYLINKDLIEVSINKYFIVDRELVKENYSKTFIREKNDIDEILKIAKVKNYFLSNDES